MDSDPERDRLHNLDEDVKRLDTENAHVVMLSIVNRYRTIFPPPQRPLWQLVQDMEHQAAVYSNIIEDLKSGKGIDEVKMRYESTLGLIPKDTLPNPVVRGGFQTARKWAQRYAEAMIEFVRDFGQTLLRQELGFGAEHTATFQVQIGFSPSIVVGTEYTRGLGAQ